MPNIFGEQVYGQLQKGRAGGLKYDDGKPRWSLVMRGLRNAIGGLVGVLTFGAAKYEANSWREVEDGYERYKDALYRHLHAIESGESIDPESGMYHWDHVMANAAFCGELYREAAEGK